MENTKTSTQSSRRRQLQGVVVGVAGDKTVSVRVDRQKLNSLYQKRYTVSKKYLVHDSANSVAIGDKVTIEEIRPMSKRKRFRIVPRKA